MVSVAGLVAFFIVPPVLAVALANRWLAFFVGVVWCWGVLVAAGIYHTASDPGYDSMAPAVSVLFGWVLATLYCAPWLLGAYVAERRKAKREGRTRKQRGIVARTGVSGAQCSDGSGTPQTEGEASDGE